MIEDAFAALGAIGRAETLKLRSLDAWVGAFQTIKWVVNTDRGVRLTPEGQKAYDDMARARTVTAD